MRLLHIAFLTTVLTAYSFGQSTNNPFPPIPASDGVITVMAVECALIPRHRWRGGAHDADGGRTGNPPLFRQCHAGPLFSVSYNGKTVMEYLDVNEADWGVKAQAQGYERGVQSFALHPQFNERGARGYGNFYT